MTAFSHETPDRGALLVRGFQMLVETNWSLAQIAGRCGFSSAAHFSIAFKGRMRRTPRQHRKKFAKSGP